ncbi:endonuclease/exonuclease/phosphatase family protein [Cohnella zeiphila]|uniref:Endonuclease/exonuclease/phosphatase family protein n=1 Tax=Cohnella zeiphila TaxID=2761120 RepID=A0A7X0VXR8_9BACL|nr:endonuclease/exonuclease/phosphatase family protein [Cohnella zeiphila]MBB6733747.1 endonuclease/exonuclease/phosphatase family protein [Cohnella zeiphila]
MKLTVMTFNLRYDNPEDGVNAWPRRADKAAEAILGNRPALVGTQEGLHGMLEELDERLAAYDRIGEGREGGQAGEYNAVWYDRERLEALEHGQFWLSETPSEPGSMGWDAACTRICTWARFRSRQEPRRELLMFNTHLDHLGQTARENGIGLILRAIRQERERFASGGERERPLPVVLTGDFNAEPDNPAVLLPSKEEGEEGGLALVNAFDALEGAPGATYHGFRGGEEGEPIDYIFASRDVRPTGTKIVRDPIRGGYPSDHYPVLATIEL